MEYRFLGRSGLRVSALCLGPTMTISFGRDVDESAGRRIFDIYCDRGGNFFDNADVYSGGLSETLFGRWLEERRREDLVIATKVRYPSGTGPNDAGLSRKHLVASIDESLRRLRTDYIDLYQVHCWDPVTPLEETLSTLNRLVELGKVRYVGASNFSGWQLQKSLDLSLLRGWERFVSLQALYNLLDRSTEWELVPVCLNEGVALNPWSPLRCGWLTGTYRRGMMAPPAGSRIEHAGKTAGKERWDQYANERTWRIVDLLEAIAQTENRTPAQVALNWVLHRPGVVSPVVGPQTVEHLEDNLATLEWRLAPEHIEALEACSDLPLPYPYDTIEAARTRR